MSNVNIVMSQAAASSVPLPGSWDLSYAYYDPPEAWDISAAFYASDSFSVNAQETYPTGVFFKPDGTKMYTVGQNGDEIDEYDLSTVWYVGTASYVQTFRVNTEDSSPQDLFFKPDGTVMYVVGVGGDSVYQYALSTAWDISTASYVQSLGIIGQELTVRGLFFKPDGTKMYIIGSSGDEVNEYNLSTAWDISTASHFQLFDVKNESLAPVSLSFSSDGTKMYVLDDAGLDVNEYTLSTAWDVSTASYVQNFSVSSQETSPTGLYFRPDGGGFYVVGPNSDIIYRYTIGGFSVASEETATNGITFKPDGTKMYIIGQTGDDVNEYNLSTAWDLSTASYLQSFSVSAQELTPEDIFFKPDGTKMYVIGDSGDDINEYNLSIPWDVSTAAYAGIFSVSAQDPNPTGLFFKSDGTKMYITGNYTDDVYEYTLSTAWNVSSASYDQSFSVASQEVVPEGVFFKPDGTKMYVIGSAGDDVNEYDLSTAWDLSTASYLQTFSVRTEAFAPTGIYFKPDGTQMFIVGSSTDRVYSYTLRVQ